ncbi:MAG: substrate-binding domain-containing protein [Candidatus Aramenus sp.]|jgi:hypothetical protein|nr:substrate-binding domain-containing protein [Candidatus Aramenus sp.]
MELNLPLFDNLEDLWGDISGVRMSFAGNQWFVVKDLIEYIEREGLNVYVETIPPGIVRKRAEGEPLKIGNLLISLKPEIVSLPPSMLKGLKVKEKFDYVENDLAIVFSGQPIKNWCELKGKRIAIPNPKTEGIGKLFMEIYEESCGNYEELVHLGAYLTAVHHREIPNMLKLGDIEAGVMWRTEALYWGFKHVVPEKNRTSRLAFALLEGAGREAEAVFNILKRPQVREIYRRYGFKVV